MGHTTDGDHTSVCQGVETDVDSGHWSGGAKKEREDNSVLPLFLPVPLEGTRLLIIPGDFRLHGVASAPEAAVGGAGRVRTERLSRKRWQDQPWAWYCVREDLS